MFREMENVFKEQVLSFIQTINEPAKPETSEIKQTLITSHNEPSEFSGTSGVKIGDKKDNVLNIGRNDPCPCGAINPATGEVYKWKKCGLINTPQHRKSLIN